jgi:hypothetical protein
VAYLQVLMQAARLQIQIVDGKLLKATFMFHQNLQSKPNPNLCNLISEFSKPSWNKLSCEPKINTWDPEINEKKQV